MKLFLILLSFSISALAQDMRAARVEAFFREQAKAVMTPELESVLAAGMITVVKEELKDNGGSLVDAIGEPGKVTLSEERWMTFLREGRDVRLLVLHELLRMAGVNDDNYRMSRRMIPQTPIVAEARPYCDLRVARTVTEERTKKMTGEGFGRPPENGAIIVFGGSNQRIAQENAILDLNEKCRAKGYLDGVIVQGGYSSMSRENTNGFIRNETKVVMEGLCIKRVSVQRAKKDQKAEGCQKALLCRELLSEGVITPLLAEDAAELDEALDSWRCL
jgi:hypothetical protein